MTASALPQARREDSPERRILLVGNPNVGKSALFGLLTGKYAVVSNYPGTTVEIARGEGVFHGRRAAVVDAPGANSLLAMSEDERVTRDMALETVPPRGTAAVVADAKNLPRALVLVLEMAEMEIPAVLALNMHDEALSRGVEIDSRGLEAALGVPVTATVAVERRGVSELAASFARADVPRLAVRYPKPVEDAVAEIFPLLPPPLRRRGVALAALCADMERDPWMRRNLPAEARRAVAAVQERLRRGYDEPLDAVIHRARHAALEGLARRFMKRSGGVPPASLAARLGAWAMHPVWGYAVLALVLAGIWAFVGVFGAGTLVGFVEETLFGEYINPAALWFFERFVPFAAVRDFFVGEYGLITMGVTYSVAIVLPIVATFFLAFGLLEDSGYLARLALMMHRAFRAMGLHGKAVLPMVLGLGCDTMATMTTRILETRKERVITTLLLVLAVPCSAQLGVLAALMAALPLGAFFLWAGVLAGSLFSIGWLAARVLPGKTSAFILEVPPIRKPALRNIAVKTLGRIEWYLKEAVPLFLAGTALMFVFDRLHVLDSVRRVGEPVVRGFLGLPVEAADAFVMGFLRRDFGAAGLFALLEDGRLSPSQALVSCVVITLFVPCVANFLMAVKELGWKTGLAVAAFVFPFAVLMGGAVNYLLRFTGWFSS